MLQPGRVVVTQVNKMDSKLDQALHMLNMLVHRPRAVSLTVPVRAPADTDDL